MDKEEKPKAFIFYTFISRMQSYVDISSHLSWKIWSRSKGVYSRLRFSPRGAIKVRDGPGNEAGKQGEVGFVSLMKLVILHRCMSYKVLGTVLYS